MKKEEYALTSIHLQLCTVSFTAIKNQSGLTKEYQLLERPGMDENEQYLAWKVAIKNMDPKHDDNTLLTTLKLHERWSREYLCRLV